MEKLWNKFKKLAENPSDPVHTGILCCERIHTRMLAKAASVVMGVTSDDGEGQWWRRAQWRGGKKKMMRLRIDVQELYGTTLGGYGEGSLPTLNTTNPVFNTTSALIEMQLFQAVPTMEQP